MKAAYDLTHRSFADIIDHSLPKRDEYRIKEIVREHAHDYAGFHDLKPRLSGPEFFIDFHFVMPGKISVEESHDFADHLESDIRIEFPRSNITIHIEPYNE